MKLKCGCEITSDGKFNLGENCTKYNCKDCELISQIHPFGEKRIKNLLFKQEIIQLYDIETGTYTYIIVENTSKLAIIIDSVRDNFQRDSDLIKELGLELKYILDTHVHADHVTGAFDLKKEFGAKIVLGSNNKNVKNVDLFLDEGDEIQINDIKLKAILTPGHTAGCTSFSIDKFLFTGDTLLIRSVGRTDFQEGDPKKLYNSIQKLYDFDDGTIVFPAHNYKGLTQTSIKEEKKYNEFITKNTTEKEFIEKMNNRELPTPKYIDMAVPSNMISGEKVIKG